MTTKERKKDTEIYTAMSREQRRVLAYVVKQDGPAKIARNTANSLIRRGLVEEMEDPSPSLVAVKPTGLGYRIALDYLGVDD